MARPFARLKLGYFPLPIEESQNIRVLLMPSGQYAGIDSCVGDGSALIEITKDRGASVPLTVLRRRSALILMLSLDGSRADT